MGFVYYALAETMVARTPVRRCEGCTRFFEVTDNRERDARPLIDRRHARPLLARHADDAARRR